MSRQYALAFSENQSEQNFDPIQATFSGGKEDAFNRWFPYLEGYSPDFVHTILDTYSPSAKRIIDPFGGTATTAFVAAERGLESYICEVNPVMQFLFRVKTRARLLNEEECHEIGKQLKDLYQSLATKLEESKASENLASSYESAFGDSQFFEEGNYKLVLKARSLADRLETRSKLLGDLFTVAAMSSLLSCSLLKRAGDVRYMTEKDIERRGIPNFQHKVTEKLRQIRKDILTDDYKLEYEPKIVLGNAKDINVVPSLEADTLITSPPYINGTNYFRNTRLELWFLRCISNKEDLRGFRDQAITAGINDVRVSTAKEAPNDSVQKVVTELAEDPYDRRIPLMVASYFAEITATFKSLSKHLKDGATVAIDIGDSIYGGVHVPADKLYIQSLSEIGYTLKDEVLLRERRSKDGTPLKQVLLVFDYQSESKSYVPTVNGEAKNLWWGDSWETFKRELPFQKRPYSKRNWGHNLHSLCSYAGKLKPAIAHHLVETFVPENGRLLDPFAGVGTIPFEGAITGRKAYGLDLSTAAQTIADAKVRASEANEIPDVVSRLEEYISNYEPSEKEIEETKQFGFNGKVTEYYHDKTLKEILGARRFFRSETNDTPSELLVQASCLHILHGNRPYALSRRSHPITPYAPSGDFEYRPMIPRIREKIERALKGGLGMQFTPGRVFLQDATSWWPNEISDLDAVITSPPFFDSTRFHIQNWLRHWFTGWSSDDFEDQPNRFIDERQKNSFSVYEPIFRQARERLKPGGIVLMHLGKSKKCDMAANLQKVGNKWFAHSEVFDESVAHCESHGMRDKGTVTDHQYLVFW